MSIFENRNPPPTNWTFGSGRNQVGVGQFEVVGLWSSLDSPIDNSPIKTFFPFHTLLRDGLVLCISLNLLVVEIKLDANIVLG